MIERRQVFRSFDIKAVDGAVTITMLHSAIPMNPRSLQRHDWPWHTVAEDLLQFCVKLATIGFFDEFHTDYCFELRSSQS